jgi:heavy metal translocating P-type ATPase
VLPRDEKACYFCGLPVRVSPQARANAEPNFCCFGCRIASRIVGSRDLPPEQTGISSVTLGLAIFFGMNVMVFSMFLWSQTEHPENAAARVLVDLSRYILLLLSLPVVVMLWPPLLDDAIQQWSTKSWREGRVSTSALLAFGVIAALAYSMIAAIRGSGHVYFEVAVVVLTTTTLGKWLEATGREKTTAALRSLATLLPETATRITPQGDETVQLAEIAPGDAIRILPGQRVVCDGVILSGTAEIDEQIVSGESSAVAKSVGSLVFSGSLNCDGLLVVQAISRASDGALARIIAMVQSATSMKSPQQRLADTISSFFVPIVVILAVVAAGLRLGPLSKPGEPTLARAEAASLSALSVIVVACPCALSLATPLALWAAVGSAAKRQVLLRSGDAFASLAKAKVICFDKTGTLTTGKPQIAGQFVDAGLLDEPEAWNELAIAAVHPLAEALRGILSNDARAKSESTIANVRRHNGRGVESIVPDGQRVFLGHPDWVCQQQRRSSRPDWETLLKKHNGPSVAIGREDGTGGLFLVTETLRNDAPPSIEALQQMGLKVVILSGDRCNRVRSVASAFGIEFLSELLPEQKLAAIAALRAKYGPVAMVGDGINDAPAIAAADVGIALGCGADVTRETADVCLLGERLDRLPESIDLARRTVGVMRWNILWSFAYNAVAMILAVFGFVHPIVAAIAMAISGLLVIAQSLSLTDSPEPQSLISSSDESVIQSSDTPLSATSHA